MPIITLLRLHLRLLLRLLLLRVNRGNIVHFVNRHASPDSVATCTIGKRCADQGNLGPYLGPIRLCPRRIASLNATYDVLPTGAEPNSALTEVDLDFYPAGCFHNKDGDTYYGMDPNSWRAGE